MVLIDEAHLVPRDGFGMYLTLIGDLGSMNNSLRVIGLTSTPYRTDSGRLDTGEVPGLKSVARAKPAVTMSAAITPSAGGTSVVSAYWIEASNTLSIGDTVKVERSLGGFAAGTTYYVVAQDVNSYQLSATSGGSPIAPTAFGDVNVFDGDQHVNVPWIGDTVSISLCESTVGVEPDLLGTYQIIAIPQIRLVRESTSDDDLHIRSCVYRGLYKSLA